ncbi:NAD-dependent epimerase/dehydratase family protein [Bifidobacterium sp. 82T10]|uniref:NAD-dependent epimerase/dehydratase family protein n=1 Tax=Bifidobacterium miconis TaxID=2834435 RepID=A0ABS6WH41_9BIFI|nr:NAD-dependent epimerase/dehydratase family protein [Bifidobacterium miconis]MBW3093272.1 NAD-dependent epimerase/dehydratase family protein [Bifidobacterium miconis]
MRKIVVLGCGFLGRKLIDGFLKDPTNVVVGFNRSISVPSSDHIRYVQGTFASGYDFGALVADADLVIHLVSTSVPGTEKRSLDEIQANVIPSVELFDACMAQGVKRLVFLSSGGTVYGRSPYRANRESDPPAPYNTYGLQKVMIEQALQLTAHYSDMQYQIIRLSNPYGPGQNPRGPLGLITKLVYQAINHETIHIFGDGSVVRDFIYIDDAIQGIMDIIDKGETNTIYNLGRGTGASVTDVTSIIERVVPERISITHAPARKVDVPYSVLDIAKYRQITSLDGFVSLEDGIKRTYSFFAGQR